MRHRSRSRSRDWLAELHRTGDWRRIVGFLIVHQGYLAESMARFALQMSERRTPPTPAQLALIISLRADVEALLRWERLEEIAEAAEAAAAMPPAAPAGTARVLH
jgi:hypothetical protein